MADTRARFVILVLGDPYSSRQHGVGVQVLTDINIALHDGVVSGLVDTRRFHTQERRLEHGIGTAESFVANSNDLSIG